MKIFHTLILLTIATAGFAQGGHQNMISMVPAVSLANLTGAKLITYTGDHHMTAFFARRKLGAVPAGIDMVVSDINGNILLSTGIAMDTMVTFLGGGGCRDGGYYIVAQHGNGGYSKSQIMMIKLDSMGQVSWSSAVEFTGRSINNKSTVLEDVSGNFYINQDGSYVNSIFSLRADGTYRWGTSFGYDSLNNNLQSMCLTGDSGIMCIGKYNYNKVLSVLNYDGTIRWTKNFQTDSGDIRYKFIHPTADGGYIAGGTYRLRQVQAPVYHGGSGICKFDHDGNVDWETYYYNNSGCVIPGPVDAVQNWDGRYSVISFDNGIQHMVFSSSGDLQGYLKAHPTHMYGSLRYVDNHIVMLTYSDLLTSVGPDTMQCTFFESDHVMYICGGSNDITFETASFTDSNHRVSTNMPNLYPGRYSPYTLWPVTNINATYAGGVTVECTPHVTIHTGPNAITDPEDRGFDVSPVPASGLVKVDLASGTNADRLQLLDLAGQRLTDITITGSVATIDVSPYDDGVYLLQLTDHNTGRNLTRKIVVQR